MADRINLPKNIVVSMTNALVNVKPDNPHPGKSGD